MAISFSVIVPVYNKAQYLRRCIGSLSQQDYADYEIIAVNDGSTDDSLEILRSISNPRLRILSGLNYGVSHARNKGMCCAGNDFITFVDADDFVNHDFLSNAATEIQGNECDILLCGLTKLNQDGSKSAVIPSFSKGLIRKQDFINNFVKETLQNEGILGYVASKFIKRDILVYNKLNFDTHLRLAEDLEFWSRVYTYTNHILVSHNVGYNYLQYAENSSIKMSPQHLSQIGIWKSILEKYGTSNDSIVLVARKINSIIEAYFWDLENISFKNIKENLALINTEIERYKDLLINNADGLLQNQILKNTIFGVYSYLQLRRLYHSVRIWQN